MKRYHLHVGADGTETRHTDKPIGVPTMLVEREYGYEFTRTVLITLTPDPREQPRPVQPHGDGWALWEVHDTYVVWRRPVKRLPK